jgi:hypothetical protein
VSENPRGEHPDDPAEGSEEQGEEAEERVRRQQEGTDPDEA